MNRNPFVYARPFSADPDGGPSDAWPAQEGITLRDLAALEAFTAMIAGVWMHPDGKPKYDALSKSAYEAADAFIAERNRPYDEQQAAYAAARARLANSRYRIGEGWPLTIEEGIGKETVLALRWVFDYKERCIVAMQQRNDQGEWGPTGAGVIAVCESELKHCTYLDDPDADDIEASDELPEWAKNG